MNGGCQRDWEGRDLFRRQAGDILDDRPSRHHHVLRVGAPDVQARQGEARCRNRRANGPLLVLQWIPWQWDDTLANLKSGDSLTQFSHLAGTVTAKNVRKRQFRSDGPFPDVVVQAADVCSEHLDQEVPGWGRRCADFLVLEPVTAAFMSILPFSGRFYGNASGLEGR